LEQEELEQENLAFGKELNQADLLQYFHQLHQQVVVEELIVEILEHQEDQEVEHLDLKCWKPVGTGSGGTGTPSRKSTSRKSSRR
jgi:hypothetical protein